jgi:peptidyl-prolyl cis-trans isomerase D
MLDFFRKHAGSWLIKVALGLIVLVFIFWGGYSLKSRQESQIASIDGHYISIAEYNHAYSQLEDLYRRQLGAAYSQELVKQLGLKRQALDMLVQRYLLYSAAQRYGLTASKKEIQDVILSYPVFQTNGKFDEKRYVFMLQQNHLTPELFEHQMGTDLAIRKLQAFIERRAAVTDQEVQADFNFNYSQAQLAYVTIDPKSFEKQVVVDDKALQTFFDEHKNQYKDPEKRQLPYVLFGTDEFAKDIKISDADIKDYYDEHQSDYHKPMEVRAKHILFAVKQDAPKEEVDKVRAEAEKVLAEAKQGKDFTALAKKYSQDPSVAQNGGDLGYFTKSKMVPAFADAAFALKPGQISDLVRTPFGFHIIKVEDVRPEKTITLDEARGQIENILKKEKARDVAYAKARDFADSAYARRDIEKAAQGLKLTVSGDNVWLKASDGLAGLKAGSDKAVQKLFEMSDKETSNPLEVEQGYVVAQVKAIQAPAVPPFDAVKARVENDFKRDQEMKLAQQSATALLTAAKEKKSLDEAAKGKDFQVKQSDWFSRREPDKSLSLLPDAQNEVFRLAPASPFPEAPLKSGGSYMVCQLLATKVPTDTLEKERASIYKRLVKEKQSQLWQAWVMQLRNKADVKIFKEI